MLYQLQMLQSVELDVKMIMNDFGIFEIAVSTAEFTECRIRREDDHE
jgi:hypothetical protein